LRTFSADIIEEIPALNKKLPNLLII
jgi:hypothetical protein